MTIAACYVSPEGIVFGADSTTSFNFGGFHYYNHNQKLFEIGEESTLAIVTWGLAGLGEKSHRTLFAELGDDLKRAPPNSVKKVADRWAAMLWAAYDGSSLLAADLAICRQLHAKSAFTPLTQSPDPGVHPLSGTVKIRTVSRERRETDEANEGLSEGAEAAGDQSSGGRGTPRRCGAGAGDRPAAPVRLASPVPPGRAGGVARPGPAEPGGG